MVLGAVIFAGQLMTGSCVSLTVTLKVQVAVLPETSVAVQMTLVVPIGKKEAAGGKQLTATLEQLELPVGTV